MPSPRPEEGWIDFVCPVACGTPAYYDDFALETHCSVVNGKSSRIPQDWWPAVREFQQRMGYRLVLRKLEHADTVRPGGDLALSMLWENVGVAPPYREYPLAIELVCDGDVAARAELEAGLKGWLPGEHESAAKVSVPGGLAPGTYRIRLAFLDPRTRRPKLKLAIAGVDEEGWYRLSAVDVAQ